ncbi:MAG: DUF4139 domain-containing protein [Owenweeksia sp.]|nr:DUF4139 domain-containing protein [Owenweeksia sp.]
MWWCEEKRYHKCKTRNFRAEKRRSYCAYKILVRNNKSSEINLEIMDRFPVSPNSEIEVERLESSNGKVEEKSGIITWDHTLTPAEERALDLDL